MSASEPGEGRVHWGHFILRVQRPARGQAGMVYVVEDVRSGERGRFDRLEDALAFIQEHLAPEDENG
jgi:hypothetical protein